jgi:uncharacterized protein YigE (DUF2233 family)
MHPNGALLVDDAGARVRETSEVAAGPGTLRLASQSAPHLLWFAISDGPASFHDIATLFRDVLHCPDALYLDGSISAWCPGPGPATAPSTATFSGIFYVSAPL